MQSKSSAAPSPSRPDEANGFLTWWFPHPHEGHGRQPCQVISQDGWNLIHYIEANETELYNLDIDQSERNNLAQAEPERTREMLETLNQWVQRTRRY